MELPPIQIPESILPQRAPDNSSVSTTERNFADFITSAVGEVNRTQIEGDRAIESLHNGEAGNLHDVMIAMEQADISLRMLVQVRNKALQAYEEVMRMQI